MNHLVDTFAQVKHQMVHGW